MARKPPNPAPPAPLRHYAHAGGHDSHPAPSRWTLFLHNLTSPADRESLNAHLAVCAECQKLLTELPPPPYRILGRPAPSPILRSPLDVEADAQALLRSIPDSGAVIRLAGDWAAEAAVYQVAALVLARLARKGWSKSIHGSTFGHAHTPAPPLARVSLLLDATAYDFRDSFDYSQAPLAPAPMATTPIPASSTAFLATHPADPNDPT